MTRHPKHHDVVDVEDEQRQPQGFAEHFRHASRRVAMAVGSAWAFLVAVLVVVVWAATGPLFHYSDTWQLVINTGTTVVTFLMVFLIQNTQNRDSREIHLKLDELLRAISRARTRLADLDELSDKELDSLLRDFHHARRRRGLPELDLRREETPGRPPHEPRGRGDADGG